MKTLCLLLLATAAVLTPGCASNQVLVCAQRNTLFSPSPEDKIALTLRPGPDAEDATLGSLLAAEMKREGFNIVTNTDADYSLAYLVEDDSTEQTYLHQRTIPASPPQTTRDVLTPGVTGPSQTLPPTTVTTPTTLEFRRTGIRLYLFTNSKTHPGVPQIAWTGCVQVEKTIPPESEPALIKMLLGHFGRDYLGRVEFPK